MKRVVMGAVLVLLLGLTAEAQSPGRWVKLAPFPEPSEELYGAATGGKFYVFGGLAPGWKPKALVYEYDPAADRWTKKQPMPLASHHVAFADLNGKIYAFGGFVLPSSEPPAWAPIDNVWEYDPAADTWKALAPMPTKRGSPVAAVVGGKNRHRPIIKRLRIYHQYWNRADRTYTYLKIINHQIIICIGCQ